MAAPVPYETLPGQSPSVADPSDAPDDFLHGFDGPPGSGDKVYDYDPITMLGNPSTPIDASRLSDILGRLASYAEQKAAAAQSTAQTFLLGGAGQATITAGQTSVVVNHGISTVPTVIFLNPVTDTLGARWRVSARTATTFTISLNAAQASDITFDWTARLASAATYAVPPSDPAVGVPGLRTLGTGPLQALPGSALGGELVSQADSAGRASRRAMLLDLILSPLDDVLVWRISSTRYRLMQAIGGAYYWGIDLTDNPFASGGYSLLQLGQSSILAPMLAHDDTNASVVHTGAGWAAPVTQASAYGGAYRYTLGVGDFALFTSPAGVTRVGVRTVGANNAGIAKVEVDGATANANLLPTAQDLVNRGILVAGALTTNGGTLAPTDRVLDTYKANPPDYDYAFGIADDLTPGVHTVKLTCTGYQNVAASAARLYSSGYAYATATTTIATPGTTLVVMQTLLPDYISAYEYAYKVRPTAGGTATFVGQLHGYEEPVSFALYLDGTPLTMVDGDLRMGREVTAIRVSNLHHPEVGAGVTSIATSTVTYRLTRTGLRVVHKQDWLQSMTHQGASYSHMFPLDGSFTRGSINGVDVDYALDGDTADAYYGKTASDLIWAWQKNGRYAALLYVPDPRISTNAWVDSGDGHAMLEDRDANITKAYITRIGALHTVAVVNGTQWRAHALYRLARFRDPDFLLARAA